jgi:hypothetical protein
MFSEQGGAEGEITRFVVDVHLIQHVGVCLHVGLSKKVPRLASQLHQFVSVEHVAINGSKPNVRHKTYIFNGQGPTATCHTSEDWLLLSMNKETEDTL